LANCGRPRRLTAIRRPQELIGHNCINLRLPTLCVPGLSPSVEVFQALIKAARHVGIPHNPDYN
jgi:hypothetical protein